MIPKRRKAPKMGLRERPQVRCDGHLKWIRGNECSIVGKHECWGKMEAAHVRTGTDGCKDVKPSDFWAIPLCGNAHREQHNIGERRFERKYGIDMKEIARGLSAKSPHRLKWETRHGR